MSISFGGVGELCVTFKTTGTVTKGSPVKMSSNDTVAACSNGDRFIGIAVDVKSDGYCTVQVSGFTVMAYSGTAPTVGYAMLAADASGGVKAAASGGGEHLVLNVDTTGGKVGFII
ncbi:MAG: hypothetical protein IJL71_02160 [Oscillospiraceae bacterium]|nr:hypothetical protein [Oscillospiraceae bacterium]